MWTNVTIAYNGSSFTDRLWATHVKQKTSNNWTNAKKLCFVRSIWTPCLVKIVHATFTFVFLHKNMSCWTMSFLMLHISLRSSSWFLHHVQQHHKCIISRHRPRRSISTFVRTSRCSMAESQWALCLCPNFTLQAWLNHNEHYVFRQSSTRHDFNCLSKYNVCIN